jgi:hypothetical protein
MEMIRLGSPGLPRQRSDPSDYLRRAVGRAEIDLQGRAFSAAPAR